MSNQPDKLVELLLTGNIPALARVLSLIEDNSVKAKECLNKLFPHTGRAKVLGITGSPGAGKSTLVDQLVIALRKQGQRVAVLAIDPSSPFTGGALLGDRIRMSAAAEDKGVFIRSMATRGALGGLSPCTAESIFALDAAGFDYILVETVGVGQAEVEIVKMADTVVLVLVPGMGDGVQALKAGIIEIADIFAVNKADLDGVDRVVKELREVMSLTGKQDWEPPITKVVATQGKGIDELLKEICNHQKLSTESGRTEKRREGFLKEVLYQRLSGTLLNEAIEKLEAEGQLDLALENIRTRQSSPIEVAESIAKNLLLKADPQ